MFNIPCISHSEVILSQVIVQVILADGLWVHVNIDLPLSHLTPTLSMTGDSLPCTDFYHCYGFNIMIALVMCHIIQGHIVWGHIVQSHIFQGHTGQWMAYGSMWTPQSFNSYFEYNWDVLRWYRLLQVLCIQYDEIFGHFLWVNTEEGISLIVWLISGHASLKSWVCEVNPYAK